MPQNWSQILEELKREEHGCTMRLPAHTMEHPRDAGMSLSVGLPMGQRNDYRLKLDDCSGLHVRDFRTHYEAHIDKVHPSCDPVEHALRDAPGATILGMTALGSLLGGLLGRTKESFLAGAVVGAFLASAAVALSDPSSSPATPSRRRKRHVFTRKTAGHLQKNRR